jgi:hypothetical protein
MSDLSARRTERRNQSRSTQSALPFLSCHYTFTDSIARTALPQLIIERNHRLQLSSARQTPCCGSFLSLFETRKNIRTRALIRLRKKDYIKSEAVLYKKHIPYHESIAYDN